MDSSEENNSIEFRLDFSDIGESFGTDHTSDQSMTKLERIDQPMEQIDPIQDLGDSYPNNVGESFRDPSTDHKPCAHIPEEGERRGYRIIPQHLREQLVHLVMEEGKNVQQAVNILGIKYSAAINIVRRYRETGVLECGSRGRKSRKVLPEEDKRKVQHVIATNTEASLDQLRGILKARGLNIPPSMLREFVTKQRQKSTGC